MQKQIFILIDGQRKYNAKQAIDSAPEGYVCEIKEKTRTLEQNAKLHAMISEIAKQVVWNGQKMPIHIWKRLCMAAYLRDKKENPLLVPALDGHGVDIIYEKTSQLNVQQCSELIEWCYSFGIENNVLFKESLP